MMTTKGDDMKAMEDQTDWQFVPLGEQVSHNRHLINWITIDILIFSCFNQKSYIYIT